ncbi:trypsin-like serine peptidase [Streptomyces sp. NPDC101132]|uniref:trypsin-like serine peptidase n=1 Tax=Streptomyces sp. NPDC101132 TaxID=3366110 RepID=UPI00382CB365
MRRFRKVLLPLAAATTLAVSGIASAEAVAAPSSPTTTDSAFATKNVQDDAAKAAVAYWTPERMKNAISLDRVATKADEAVAAKTVYKVGNPGSTAPAQATEGKPSSAFAPTASRTAGKVFFKNPQDGKNYVCSASAINSASKQMVATAGHCVHGGKGGKWMTNWTFVPRYNNGSRPYGTFAAKEFRTFTSWISSSNLSRDVAFVTTYKRSDGKKLVNVVGGNGLSYNYDRSNYVTIFGYPVARQNGQVMIYCQGNTSADPGTSKVRIKCNLTGGASGGPWLRKYSSSTQLGYLNGVTSTVNSLGWNKSPYFDEYVKKMFDAQGSRV